jgi:predicted phage terminase large subunit-like protein
MTSAKTLDLSPDRIAQLLVALPNMPAAEKALLLEELDDLENKRQVKLCYNDFLAFCAHVYPDWKEGPHHRHLKPILQKIVVDEDGRLTVSMPPRFGKSETIAYLFVAWYLGHNPTHHIIMVTHTASLSATFGRKIRNLIDGPKYQAIFPKTQVSKDKSAADDWTTTAGGKYFAIGIGANVAGHGAHLLIADDLVSEQALVANPDTVFENAWQYMQVGPLQRLMPGGRIVMIGTRWGKKDPIGRALQWAETNEDAPQWHEVRFPAILPSGRSLWPDQWPLDKLEAKRASMFPQFWAAQYMQEPTSEEGAIIKREWWREWEEDEPPECEIIMMALDAAAEMNTRADFTALLTWGVFRHDRLTKGLPHIILLNAINVRVEFPELKDLALKEYEEWEPDIFIVEKKSSGTPLFQELRSIGIPVSEFTPHRGTGDKYARISAVADIFRSGMVWYPAGRRWAQEVIDQVAEFPNGEHDDMVDCTSMTMSRFRTGGFIRLGSDYEDNERIHRSRRAAYY